MLKCSWKKKGGEKSNRKKVSSLSLSFSLFLFLSLTLSLSLSFTLFFTLSAASRRLRKIAISQKLWRIIFDRVWPVKCDHSHNWHNIFLVRMRLCRRGQHNLCTNCQCLKVFFSFSFSFSFSFFVLCFIQVIHSTERKHSKSRCRGREKEGREEQKGREGGEGRQRNDRLIKKCS